MHLAFAASISAVSLVVIYVIKEIRQSLHHAARQRELGCKPPVWLTGFDAVGMTDVIRGLKAANNKEYPVYVERNFLHESELRGRPVGTVRLRTPFFREVFVTTDPANIQALLALQFKDFGLGVNRTENFAPLLGNGIFASNGKKWEHSRALLRPQFIRGQVSDLNLEENHVQAFMSVLDRQLNANGWTNLVDLQVLFFRLTLDSATEFLFGQSINSQFEDQVARSDKDVSFSDAFDRSQYIISIAARFGPNYWMAHVPELGRMVKVVHGFVDYFVQMALTQHSDGDKPGKGEKYVFLQALAKETQNPEELRSELLNILLAGRDTTASTLGWFFYTLSKPQYTPVFNRLRKIILDEFGTYSNPRGITFESMKNCQYLQWCLNEILRMYPAVPVNVRTALVDTTLPVGGGPDGKSPIYIKKGQDVGYAVYVMHRRKDLWGHDADVFKPERWEKRRPGWDFLPFNGGPRICIGQQFALTEVGYVVVRLMQRIDEIDGSQAGAESHNLTLTNCPGEGVNVRLHFAE